MKNIFPKLPFSLLAIFGMITPGTLSAGCLPSAPSGYTVPFTLVTLQNYSSGNQHATYAVGSLAVSHSNKFLSSSTTYSNTGTVLLFSDRYVPCGNNCFPTQPFDINQANLLDVEITESTSFVFSPPITVITVTLTDGGKLSFAGTCDSTSGVLYGTMHGDTHVAVTLGTPEVAK